MRFNNYVVGKVIDFPKVRQSTSFSCGAAAVQAVLAYYEDDMPREGEVMKWLKTVPVEIMNIGTAIQTIVSFFLGRNYLVDHQEFMDIETLLSYINKEIPVIVLVQSWAENRPKDYTFTYDDGHYIVAIGYDKTRRIMYFEDPSLEAKGFLLFDELNRRWHAIDENGKKVEHYGIAVYGKTPLFNSKIYKRIE